MPESVARASWDAAALVAAFPPRLTDPNKRVVHAIACPPGSSHGGRVHASRWQPLPLPARLPPSAPALETQAGYFTYAPSAPGWMEWHLNFADPNLFAFYGGGLFAQDEMQVAEHPALASVREALPAAGIPALTVEAGRPTPVLVAGVERRCEVDTAPALEPGRESGLYGNRFSRAPAPVVRSATRRIDPPTLSNILAIAAIPGGYGAYTASQIERTLLTAYTGFAGAVAESALHAPGAKVAIHTGFWGCGAFGGDRVLMTVLQLLAARLAGVDRVVFHLGDATGRRSVEDAVRYLARPLGEDTAGVVATIAAAGFRWGVSDGN